MRKASISKGMLIIREDLVGVVIDEHHIGREAAHEDNA